MAAPHPGNRVDAFLSAPRRFAVLATLDPDGTPRQAVIWYRRDPDGRITVNSAEGRRWPANLRRDPRCSLAVLDGADGYTFVAVTGRVSEIIDDQQVAQADIAALARHYRADDPAKVARLIANFQTQHRISFRIDVVSAHDHLED